MIHLLFGSAGLLPLRVGTPFADPALPTHGERSKACEWGAAGGSSTRPFPSLLSRRVSVAGPPLGRRDKRKCWSTTGTVHTDRKAGRFDLARNRGPMGGRTIGVRGKRQTTAMVQLKEGERFAQEVDRTGGRIRLSGSSANDRSTRRYGSGETRKRIMV